jgi:hypothetical protein
MPITWKNINAPSFTDVNSSAAAAAKMITGGLGKLASTAEDYSQGQQEAWEQTKAANTQNVLNEVAGLNDLAGYDALQQRLNPQALQQQYGAQVDTSKILSALGQRDNQLMQDETDAYNYQNTLAERTAAPLRNQFNALLGANDYKGAQAFLDANKDIIPNAGELYNTLETNQREDSDYNYTTGQRNMKDSAATIIQDVARNVDDESKVMGELASRLKEAGVSGAAYNAALNEGRQTWGSWNQLTEQQRQEQSALQASGEQNLEVLGRALDRQRENLNIRFSEDEIQGWMNDENIQQADAYRYVGENAGESSLFTPDDWFADGKQGAENVVPAMQDLVSELETKLIRSKNPLIEQTGNSIPGAVIKRAFDMIGKDKDGQTYMSQFKRNLKKVWDQYSLARADIETLRAFNYNADQARTAAESKLAGDLSALKQLQRQTIIDNKRTR